MIFNSLGEFPWIVRYGGHGHWFECQWTLVSDLISNFGGLIFG
jgi:hypothetical protein